MNKTLLYNPQSVIAKYMMLNSILNIAILLTMFKIIMNDDFLAVSGIRLN